MSSPFLAEIIMFGGNFAPRGWAFCDGQLLNISQNTALFAILGTTYGGDGRTTFALPDLRGRDAIHPGTGPGLPNVKLGEKSGTHNYTLNANNIPSHTHTFDPGCNTGGGDDANPQGRFPANSSDTGQDLFADTANAAMGTSTTNATGNGQSFSVTEPFLGINHIIALVGIFPSRN